MCSYLHEEHSYGILHLVIFYFVAKWETADFYLRNLMLTRVNGFHPFESMPELMIHSGILPNSGLEFIASSYVKDVRAQKFPRTDFDCM